MKYGIIAGNGRFPVIALETARRQGDEAIAIAIKEEASKDVERVAARCYWVSLGELSRLIEICKSEGIAQIMMAGQVKHAKIFSSIRPDWRLVKLLAALLHKNTDSLIGAVAKVLEDEGIRLVDSTLLLKPLLAPAGAITKRRLGCGRAARHRLRAEDRACAGESRSRAKRGDRGSGLRGAGGDGRHGRDAAARGRPGGRASG